MAVFRIEKTKDFTIMANHHLRNRSLSLKAKGLQSLMISLPDVWSYSLKGLAKISRDGVESIGTALQELERHGYLTRRQIRDDRGKFLDMEYTIHEIPVPHEDEPADVDLVDEMDDFSPDSGNPEWEEPQPGNPDAANPDSENPAQLRTKDQVGMNQESTRSRTHRSIRAEQTLEMYPMDEIDSINPTYPFGAKSPPVPIGARDPTSQLDTMAAYRSILRENIGYEDLCERYRHRADEIDELLELMLEAVCSTRKTIRVGGEDKPTELVKSRMLQISQDHIEYVLERLAKNTTEVRNIRGYLLTAIYNAPTTIGNYVAALVNHGFCGSK